MAPPPGKALTRIGPCLDEDPEFAPAWAHLGRCHCVIDKYFGDPQDNDARSEEALRRALELSPFPRWR